MEWEEYLVHIHIFIKSVFLNSEFTVKDASILLPELVDWLLSRKFVKVQGLG